MANKFRKRSQADADLDSIWNYITADNIKAADKLVTRVGAVFEMLVQNPLAGHERPELAQDCAASQLAITSYFTSRVRTASKSLT
jgi:toxin ParE1/3/4